ncbi:hypothetical protein WJX79_009653 [Trebouxia sp. C0005]
MTSNKASWGALAQSEPVLENQEVDGGKGPGISINMSSARTDDELGLKLQQSQDKLVWTMFGSSWCHHCHELFPSVYEISKRFQKQEFVVAQMDYMDHAVKGIKYTPTFRLYKSGRRMDEFVGTDAQRVQDHVWLWSDSNAGSH